MVMQSKAAADREHVTLMSSLVNCSQGIEVLTKACEQCKASIDAHKGRLLVKEAARAVCSLPDPEQSGVPFPCMQNDGVVHCRG